MTKAKQIPLRSCGACGQQFPKKELIRIVRTPSGGVEADPTGKRPGRGTYLCPKEECWTSGLRKGRLDHALRIPLLQEDRKVLSGFFEEQLKPIGVGDVK